jgi:hypothetical protein
MERREYDEKGKLGMRKGRVVPVGNCGESVVLWEDMRLEDACTECGVFVVSRNGDSSVTLRAVSGLPLSSPGGVVQRRIYFEYDDQTSLFRIRSGKRYLCANAAASCVEMKDETPEGEQGRAGQGRVHTGRGTSEGGGATLWEIQVLPRSALGIPSREFVGVAGDAVGEVSRSGGGGGKKAQWGIDVGNFRPGSVPCPPI